ncbi:hypothetical protein CBR_g25938 [Chara braunii]|uniref:Integrase catalytic domain-containing protein n=1 Tax=Chara braunii TaxID=69332 RepID=A0A388L6U6_CHABU|nr:hypothetical protein CBR_g25938 [Chara braunii]|eukprot:GBG78004.1 hypothetical protein CBR_g25938 [Chara braunii]
MRLTFTFDGTRDRTGSYQDLRTTLREFHSREGDCTYGGRDGPTGIEMRRVAGGRRRHRWLLSHAEAQRPGPSIQQRQRTSIDSDSDEDGRGYDGSSESDDDMDFDKGADDTRLGGDDGPRDITVVGQQGQRRSARLAEERDRGAGGEARGGGDGRSGGQTPLSPQRGRSEAAHRLTASTGDLVAFVDRDDSEDGGYVRRAMRSTGDVVDCPPTQEMDVETDVDRMDREERQRALALAQSCPVTRDIKATLDAAHALETGIALVAATNRRDTHVLECDGREDPLAADRRGRMEDDSRRVLGDPPPYVPCSPFVPSPMTGVTPPPGDLVGLMESIRAACVANTRSWDSGRDGSEGRTSGPGTRHSEGRGLDSLSPQSRMKTEPYGLGSVRKVTQAMRDMQPGLAAIPTFQRPPPLPRGGGHCGGYSRLGSGRDWSTFGHYRGRSFDTAQRTRDRIWTSFSLILRGSSPVITDNRCVCGSNSGRDCLRLHTYVVERSPAVTVRSDRLGHRYKEGRMAQWLASPTYSDGPEMPIDVKGGVSVVMPEEGTWTDLESAYQTVMLAESDAFLWIETMWTKVTLARITPCLLDLEFRGTVEARGWIYLSKKRETAMVVELTLGKLPYKLFREAEREVVWAACQRVEMTMESIDVRVELGDRENVRKPYRALRAIFANNGGKTRPYEPAGHAPATAHGSRRRMGSTLKNILTSEEVTLAAPCFNDEVGRPFILETDEGPMAVGGVLIQKGEDGRERPIRFESRTLNSAERRYSQFKKEVLVILHCLKTFQAYLFGRRFILRIDPTNVAGALKNYKPIDPTVGRWVGFIWQFDYKIERIAGLRNRADGVSRVALTPEGLEEAEPIDSFLDYEGGTLVVDSEMAGTTCTTGELLIKALEKGPPAVVAELREGTVTRVGRKEEKDAWGSVVKPRDEQIALAVEGGWRRVMSIMESQELEMQRYQAYQVDNNQTGTQEEEQFFLIKSYEGLFREIGLLLVGNKEPHEVSPKAREEAYRYVLRRGHLFRKEEGLMPRRVVCGRMRQLDIIQAMHDGLVGGHRSSKGTLAKITPLYYWPGMASMVATYCQTRKICQERSMVRIFEPLRPTHVLGPGHMVHLDLAVMPVSRKGYRYIPDARDNLSGFVEATSLKKKTRFAVADWVEDFYLRHPFIRRFIADNGTEFVNQDILNTCKRLSVPIKLTEPYHPEANALVERGHQRLKNTIAKLAADDLGNWPDYLRHAVSGLDDLAMKGLCAMGP